MPENDSFQTHIISSAHSALTIEEYLKRELSYSGRSLQRLTRVKNGILLNNKKTHLKRQLREHDILKIRAAADTDYGARPEKGDVDILYEDEFLIVVNKPPFKLVHPAGRTTGNTLANHLAHCFQARGILVKIRPLHRLDRDTSGCVVFAKDAQTQANLEEQLRDNLLKRRYQAVVEGIVEPPDGTIDVPIAKDTRRPNRRVAHPDGLPAVTRYRTLGHDGARTLLELTLETGRTHQIRVHLAHIGHPVAGDKMYGRRSPLISRQALHAAQISFRHPVSQETVAVAAPLPGDMKRLCGENNA